MNYKIATSLSLMLLILSSCGNDTRIGVKNENTNYSSVVASTMNNTNTVLLNQNTNNTPEANNNNSNKIIPTPNNINTNTAPSKTVSTTKKLSGTYEMLSLDTFRGGTLCFFADKASAQYIPRSKNDQRMPWFCFTNQDAAKTKLKISNEQSLFQKNTQCASENEVLSGSATIEVTNYTLYTGETDGTDLATLDKVLTSTPPMIRCEKSQG